jgi:hypothetical protein
MLARVRNCMHLVVSRFRYDKEAIDNLMNEALRVDLDEPAHRYLDHRFLARVRILSNWKFIPKPLFIGDSTSSQHIITASFSRR